MSRSVHIRWVLSGLFLLLYAVPGMAEQAAEDGAVPLAGQPIGAGDYLQMFSGLLLVIVVIFALAWAMRRMSRVPGVGGGALRVLGGLSVGQRERVVLVQIGEEQLLIGIAPGQIRTLHKLDTPLEMAGPSTVGNTISFAQRLNSVLKGQTRP